MSDLIERAKRYLNQAAPHIRQREACKIIENCIKALSPVLPDELLHMLDRLRNERYITTADWILKEVREAADLLERQARNYESACRLMEMKDDDRDKLQQRIEDLETALTSAGDSYEVLGKLCIEAQAQVKELEAALTEVIEAQHSGFIDNCSDETQRLYTKMNNRQVTI